MGRTTELTSFLSDNFCKELSECLSITDTCIACNISRGSYYNWLHRAKKDGEENKIYRDFMRNVMQVFVIKKKQLYKDYEEKSDAKDLLKLIDRIDQFQQNNEMVSWDLSLLEGPIEVASLCYLIAKVRGEKPNDKDYMVTTTQEALAIAERTIK